MSQASEKGQQPRPKKLIWITLAVIAVVILLNVISKQQADKEKQPIRVSELPSVVSQPVIGSENAPVTLVEFGDFLCPSCQVWNELYFPQLKEDYVDSGKLKVAYINTMFHGEQSKLAALAAEAVWVQDPEAYWIYHDALFKAQPVDDHHKQWVTRELLLDLAKVNTPQIDLEQLEKDIQNESAMAELNEDQELVTKYQVRFTPTIMINGIILDDPFNYEHIVKIIDQELGAVK